jgi:membrane protease YdiL (CAAX protease family)
MKNEEQNERGKLTPREITLDLTLLLTLSTAYILTTLLAIPGLYIIPAIALDLLRFGLHLRRRGKESPRDLGLRADNLAQAALPVAAWTVSAAAGILVYAFAAGRRPWAPELAILLPLYPVYGVAQQLIFQGILHRRLLALLRARGPALLLTAVVFALVHLPSLPLVLLTFPAGIAWSWLFQRWPNVWLLGISHGILASLAYPLILGENPLTKL